MKYINNITKKFPVWNISILGLAVLVFGCDNGLETNKTLDVIEYELSDNLTLQVTLDPDYVHESLTFYSQEEYEKYGVALEKAGEVRVNAQLYNELSHAFDPIEIHMLDMTRSIVIANVKYLADREAIYSIDLRNENSTRELQVFYGLSGEEDLKEIELIHSYRNKLDKLETYSFKNPSAKKLYDEFVENYSE